MGKKIGMILRLLLVSIFTLNFVSADLTQDLGRGFQEVYNIIDVLITNFIAPFVRLVLTSGTESISGDMLFAKLLFFLIVLGFVHFALDKARVFEDKKGLNWVVVIVVSILATRYLGTEALIQTIILPYSVLGIAISAGLPFIIYFLFIEVGFKGKEYSILRKVAWALFTIVFIGLWFERRIDITQAGGYASWIYPVTIFASILILLFDSTIQTAWLKADMKKSLYSIASQWARKLKRELKLLYEDLEGEERYSTPWRDTRRQIENVTKEIKDLLKGKI